jgi:hypothetical protein
MISGKAYLVGLPPWAYRLVSYNEPERLLHFSVLFTRVMTDKLEDTALAAKVPLPQTFIFRRAPKKTFLPVLETIIEEVRNTT